MEWTTEAKFLFLLYSIMVFLMGVMFRDTIHHVFLRDKKDKEK